MFILLRSMHVLQTCTTWTPKYGHELKNGKILADFTSAIAKVLLSVCTCKHMSFTSGLFQRWISLIGIATNFHRVRSSTKLMHTLAGASLWQLAISSATQQLSILMIIRSYSCLWLTVKLGLKEQAQALLLTASMGL